MDHDVQDALGKFLVVAIPLLTTLVSYLGWYAGNWFKAHEAAIQTKIGMDKWNLLVEFGQLTVKGIEQMGLKDIIENEGSAKKEAALQIIRDKANSLGITVSADELDMIIEGALREGFHKSWEPATLVTAVPDATVTAVVNDTQTITK